MFDLEQVKEFKLVIIDFLICLVYNKIIYNKEFDSGKIKFNKELIKRARNTVENYQPIRLNGILFQRFKRSNYFSIKNYKYGRSSDFIDIKSESVRAAFPYQLIDIYTKIIEKESILQMLQLIYENATYVKDITNSKCIIEKSDDNFNIVYKREILSGINRKKKRKFIYIIYS